VNSEFKKDQFQCEEMSDKKLIFKSTYPLSSNPIKNENSIQTAESTESTCAENHKKRNSEKQNELADKIAVSEEEKE